MTTQLINVLREAADRIEREPSEYNWKDHESCNCGIVAQVAMNLSAEELRRIIQRETRAGILSYGPWWVLALEMKTCSQTGLPLSAIFSALLNLGLTFFDIANLEKLRDQAIFQKASGFLDPEWGYHKSHCVVAYLRAWADILQEQQLALQPVKATEVQTVSVSVGGF